MQDLGAPAPSADIAMLMRLMTDLRQNLDPRERDHLASLLAAIVNQRMPMASTAVLPELSALSERLRGEGYCGLADLLTPEQVAQVVGHFRARPCFNGHTQASSDGIGRRLGEGAEAFHYGSFALADIVAAPFLVEIANAPQVLELAGRYLGCTPTLYSLNAWWSFPGRDAVASVSQSFHRDLDDFGFCTLFIYLTDVDEQGGPHIYVRRTHRIEPMEQELARAGTAMLDALSPGVRQRVLAGDLRRGEGYGMDQAISHAFGHLIDVVVGNAGNGLLADTYGFHMGLPPRRGPRLIFWARYGLHASYGLPSAPVEESVLASRIPWDNRARYINRALYKA